MIGGLFKSASRVAIVAAAGVLAGGVAAQAADLGGNCCADLEERVAELEATAARKGNRKVSLTIYGSVNKAILWHDSDEDDAYRSDKATVRDNGAASSRFGFRGEAQIRPDLTAGYNMEIQVYEDASVNSSGDAFTIRHNFVYLDSATFGRVSLGQTSQITDGLYEINLANAMKVPGVINEESAFLGDRFATTFADNIDGSRKQGIYYRTPTLAGFIFSAGYSHDTGPGDGTGITGDSDIDANDYWEVALRYAGEFNGVRVAAGIGYRAMEDNTRVWDAADTETILGSASIMHTPTGLFVSGGYATVDSDDHDGAKKDAFWVMAGVEKNWFGYGNTTIFGEYGEVDFDNNFAAYDYHDDTPARDGNFWGLGITQTIDAAATDLYVNFRKYEIDDLTNNLPEGNEANVLTAGMRVQF